MEEQTIREKIMGGKPFKVDNSDKMFQVSTDHDNNPVAVMDSHNDEVGIITEVTEESFRVEQKWMGREMAIDLKYIDLKF